MYKNCIQIALTMLHTEGDFVKKLQLRSLVMNCDGCDCLACYLKEINIVFFFEKVIKMPVLMFEQFKVSILEM